MSNFNNVCQVTNALVGSAPIRWSASTPDNLGTITTAGYMNDRFKTIKANDVWEINYSDTSVFPLNVGEAATYGQFQVTYNSGTGNYSLVALSSGAASLAIANNLSEIATEGAASQATALANLGVHAAKFSNAGGSATVVITDARITTASVVVASMQSSANAVTIQKVTPTANTLTILCSADPGVSVIAYHAISAVE